MDRKVRHTPSPPQQKVVTALGRFLMDVELEKLLGFLHQIGVKYSITGNIKNENGQGHFRCKIYFQVREGGDYITVEKYEGVSNKSVRSAVAAATARFFVFEEHDYHDYKGLPPDPEKNEAIV